MEQPPTVLVVDDDPVILRLLLMNFELEGYRVLTASHGAAALDRARAELPDVVVLDVMMPDVDGLEVVQTLKADATTSAIPVVLLSARAQASDVAEGLHLGVEEYVTKPFEPLDLLQRVRDLITSHRPL